MGVAYKNGSEVPTETLCRRLKELSNAVTKGKDVREREFTMRVPAEHDRDADLVLSEAATRINELEAKLAAVEKLPDEWESAEDSTGLSGEIALSGYTCADMLRDALKATP